MPPLGAILDGLYVKHLKLNHLKILGLFLFSFFLTCDLFCQSKIIHLANSLKNVDKAWVLKIDSSKKARKNLVIDDDFAGFLIFTKGKQQIKLCVYQYSHDKEKWILQIQKLASCSSIGLTEKNQIAKIKGLIIFLPVYPCWSDYSEDGKKLIQRVFTKLNK